MEEEGSGIRLSKRFSDKGVGGEVDYKTKAGTAWSHNFLNQKPWHPLSYPNQRRKWIAEQTHAQRELRAEEISREYAQEQEFFRQTALVSKKEKEKMEMMKAVSFMYVRPPGYNPESAKAAEIAEEAKKQDTSAAGTSTSGRPEVPPAQEKKKPRAKDVFGRALPTGEEFEVLKNAPKLETGVVGRAKPFGIEIRNVKCVRCGTFGHQSGDRECPLKDAIMPNEESRIKRDDPLTAILAHTDASEPLKWELKQKPGISPPRGGFDLDDPNQQIVAEDTDIFDEYGGFLTGDNVPDLLASLTSKPKKKKKSSKSKHRKRSSPDGTNLRDYKEISSSSDDRGRALKKKKHKKSRKQSESSEDSDRHRRRSNRQRHPRSSWGKHSESSSEDGDNDRCLRRSNRHRCSWSSSPDPEEKEHSKKNHHHHYHDSEEDDNDRHQKRSNRHKRSRSSSPVPEDKGHRKKNDHHYHDSKDDDNDRHQKRSSRHGHSRSSSPKPEEMDHRKKNHRHHYHDSEDDDNDRHQKRSNRHRHSQSSSAEPEDKEHRKKNHHHHYHDSKDDDDDRHQKRSNRHGRSLSNSPEPEEKEHGEKNHHHHYHDSKEENDRHQKRSNKHRRPRSSSREPEDKEHRKKNYHHRHHPSQRHDHSDYS
ncbi:hypothetical protein K7X08_020892 [Anisodus acutangulus]|uniref:CBF1-interacting co-repressor CIR N-terminal domain-containing protein n=1 Tax=Anisodus acutangulus TaxID=402998 RepID=A0A9Q1RQN8_9SOLA|nr:hypothetical protein K7X08_020892 [Anisodus acutangulus]